MRSIKFRAWDKQKKQIIMVNNLSWKTWENHNSLMGINEIVQTSETLEDRFVLMQFTGLTDKNGKEIYEGDIVKTTWGNAGISFIDGAFIFVGKNNNNYLNEKYIKERALEVIGNIYSNPELLK